MHPPRPPPQKTPHAHHISIYAVSRKLKLGVSFSSIAAAMVQLLPDHDPQLFEQGVELRPAAVAASQAAQLQLQAAEARAVARAGSEGGGATEQQQQAAAAAGLLAGPAELGHIRMFYNETFIKHVQGGCWGGRATCGGPGLAASKGPCSQMQLRCLLCRAGMRLPTHRQQAVPRHMPSALLPQYRCV